MGFIIIARDHLLPDCIMRSVRGVMEQEAIKFVHFCPPTFCICSCSFVLKPYIYYTNQGAVRICQGEQVVSSE